MNFINTQGAMSPQQLAALYQNGSPNLSPQSAGYVSDQASQMGISGGVDNFFAQRRADQYNMAAAAQQRQMEAVRNAPQVAGLQDSLYPIPTAGTPISLRPLDQQEAQRLGQSPEAYTLNRRLRLAGVSQQLVPDLTSIGAQGGNVTTPGRAGGISAEDLYSEPTFQSAMSRTPEKAHAVFQALTGFPLLGAGGFHEAYQGRRAAEIKQGTGDLHQLLMSGHARPTATGVEFSETQFDPVSGKMVPTGKYTAGDPYQKSLAKYLPNVSSQIAGFQKLAAERPADIPSVANGGLARLQPPEISGAPNFMQVDPGGNYGTSQNVVEATLGDFGRALTGRGDQMAATAGQENPYGAYDFTAPQGHAAFHARQTLANNPHFQELLRRDPARARSVIMAMQQRQ